jgi:hypothetical protein
MSVAMLFQTKSFSPKQYDEVIKRLEKANAGEPKGRTYHACFLSGNNVNVFDIWDSKEDFDKFGKTLMPILKELKADVGQPEIKEIHNVIEAKHAHAF